jgi:LysR family transcriptional regulator for bpeEF and oprC
VDKLTAMQTFVRVGELKSFTRAADSLGISRAVASAQVAELEKHLKSRLLHRTTRSVALTTDGAEYLSRCQRILAEIESAESALHAGQQKPQGRLRVDVPVTFGRYLLLPALPQFAARYPELALEVNLSDRVADLVQEQIDVAIRVGTIRGADLVARRICDTRWLTCAAPAYLERHGRPRQPQDLRRHRLIGFLSGGRLRRWSFSVRGQRESLALPCALSFNASDVQMQAALGGNGIVQAPDIVVTELIRSGKLEQVLTEYATQGPPISAVYLADQKGNLKIRVFAEFAAQLLTSWRGELSR